MFVTVESGPDRQAWVSLLELADEPVPLARYLDDGTLYGLTGDGGPRAAVLVIMLDDARAELRAVAVAETEQGKGLGTEIVERVFGALRERGVREVVVGTATSGVRQLAFYQRLGFRLTHIERDFFTVDNGYPADLSENGIPTRDMVWMSMQL
ncbi:MAG TPA: GNAT family N-acetyltransferase [Acidimicrobiia bacterium]|nr:GNAT family N-acetyltransferase [Acidimicrobiia bacterium]